VPLEQNAIGCQRIEVGRLHQRMPHRGQALAAPLIDADIEDFTDLLAHGATLGESQERRLSTKLPDCATGHVDVTDVIRSWEATIFRSLQPSSPGEDPAIQVCHQAGVLRFAISRLGLGAKVFASNNTSVATQRTSDLCETTARTWLIVAW
jgi:hypothetical protein